MSWYTQKNSGDKDAKVKETGSRVELIWGGSNKNSKADDHGHIVTNDGVNAAFVREPGGEVIVNNTSDTPPTNS